MTMAVTMTAVAAKRPADVYAECPAHILSFLKHHLGGESPIHIHAEKSAQQSVLILRYAKPNSCDKKPASSSSLMSHAPTATTTTGGSNDENTTILLWRNRLIQGNYRLVVRCWKGGSRWWNLHRNNNNNVIKTTATAQNGCHNQVVNANHRHRMAAVQELATSEIAGYKIARLAAANLRHHQQAHHDHHHRQHVSNGHDDVASSISLVIPAVLYADTDCSDHDPWAIFEYVGRNNPRFFSSNSDHANSNNKNKNNENNNNNNIYDDYWTRNMILVRDEFGFSEPHPRWGRVPVDKCLVYATTVLVEVIIPLHESFVRLQNEAASTNNHGSSGIQKRNEFQESLQNLSVWKSSDNDGDDDDDDESHKSGYTYESMIILYKSAWKEMSSSIDSNGDPTNKNNNNIEDRRLRQAIQLLGRCIDHLQEESETIKPLPHVLVHMDCQPQNLLFARRRDCDGKQQSSLHVSSVLDWEEAAYADPRFELLLLGRKVCANKAQADQIWNLYETQRNIQLGSIDPWLFLETIHSLTTLLLQAMDLAGGGRSPWESKPDLWGKIEREFGRLVARGWSFCQENADVVAATT